MVKGKVLYSFDGTGRKVVALESLVKDGQEVYVIPTDKVIFKTPPSNQKEFKGWMKEISTLCPEGLVTVLVVEEDDMQSFTGDPLANGIDHRGVTGVENPGSKPV